jgi:histidinol-phosphate/aromatic aminotransferase/cobyric acid decarboxylase-like protein
MNSENKSFSVRERISELKNESGSHSPSISTLLSEIPDIKISVDACFLSNPYATELFLKHMEEDLIKTGKLREVLEYYPPQVYDVRKFISKATGIQAENIFVGNGAIEVIQAMMHRFVRENICVILPTFSSYYEFAMQDTEVIYYHLRKEDNFKLDVEKYLTFIKDNNVRNAVIINPNNPNGGYLSREELDRLISGLSHLDNLILDESFIHFAYESVDLYQISHEEMIQSYPNLCIVKSMSKDFGIAGIRAGYGVMNKEKVNALLKNGYLWNVSGLADYFFKVYSEASFQKDYDVVRKKYIMNTLMFLSELNSIKNVKVYPSKANFALIEIMNGKTSFDYTLDLLLDHEVYVRDCSDKKGLDGQFIRVASRSFEENLVILNAIKSLD